MSERILGPASANQKTKSAFESAAIYPPVPHHSDDDECIKPLPVNGRTTGRYARQGVELNDCSYTC